MPVIENMFFSVLIVVFITTIIYFMLALQYLRFWSEYYCAIIRFNLHLLWIDAILQVEKYLAQAHLSIAIVLPLIASLELINMLRYHSVCST